MDRRNTNLCKALHLATWIFCAIMFSMNLFRTFTQYFNRETIQTTAVKAFDGKISFPSFAICSQPPYHDSKRVMLTIDDYIDNTFDPDEFITHVGWYESYAIDQHKLTKYDHLFEREHLYTYLHGRCLIFHLKTKVKNCC